MEEEKNNSEEFSKENEDYFKMINEKLENDEEFAKRYLKYGINMNDID